MDDDEARVPFAVMLDQRRLDLIALAVAERNLVASGRMRPFLVTFNPTSRRWNLKCRYCGTVEESMIETLEGVSRYAWAHVSFFHGSTTWRIGSR